MVGDSSKSETDFEIRTLVGHDKDSFRKPVWMEERALALGEVHLSLL